MRLLLLILISFNLLSAQAEQYTILVSFDGFRWDYLERGLTPNIEKLQKVGVTASSLKPVFPTKTFPNHLSIVTGLHPQNHGIILNEFRNTKTNKIYRIWDTSEVTNPDWYKGESIWETARKQNVISASYFFPGSELRDSSRQPNYFEKYEHRRPYEKRVEGVLYWLSLPENLRPKIITMYFDATDSKGHQFGPNSKELNDAIAQVDSVIGKLVSGLEKMNLLPKTNLIITTDHGMTDVSTERIVKINRLVPENVMLEWSEPIMFVWPSADSVELVYNLLKSKEDKFKTYKLSEVPAEFNFNKNEFFPPIVLISDLGWILSTHEPTEKELERFIKGNHGFKNSEKDMHGIFVASGPAFKKNYKTGDLRTIDIYPLLCKINSLTPAKNIDGDLKKIDFILNNK